MRYFFILILAVFMMSSFVCANNLNVQNKFELISNKSEELFNISFGALTILIRTSKSSYLRQDSLDKTGDLGYILELEKTKYVNIEYHVGLPDGTEGDIKFIRISPSEKGNKIIHQFLKFSIYKNAGKNIELRLKRKYEKTLKSIDDNITKADAEDVRKNDLNQDGVRDVFYEDKSEFYFQLIDRNFDGEIDERWKYDLEDKLLAGWTDDNFDGVFETRFVIQDGLIHKQLVDSDQNGFFDICHNLKFGVWEYTEKYYAASGTNIGARIGIVKFDLDQITGIELFSKTKISEIEFQYERMK